MFGFRRHHAGDTCPECGKRKLIARIGRTIFTLWRPKPWLACDSQCTFPIWRCSRLQAEAT